MRTCYTLIVGTKNWSSWSLRAWLALRAAGCDFEEVVVRLGVPDTRAEIIKFSPSGKIPVLAIEEGGTRMTVFDSLAICETLAECHPEAQLWPRDARARAEARSIGADMHSGFAALRATLPMDLVRRQPTPDLSEEVRKEISEIIRIWESALKHAGEGGFLFGAFSIADCMYAPVVSRFRTYAIALPRAVREYSERILSLPAMRDWEEAARAEVEAGIA